MDHLVMNELIMKYEALIVEDVRKLMRRIVKEFLKIDVEKEKRNNPSYRVSSLQDDVDQMKNALTTSVNLAFKRINEITINKGLELFSGYVEPKDDD